MANTNCLKGMQCPKCGSEEPLQIQIKVTTSATTLRTESGSVLEGYNLVIMPRIYDKFDHLQWDDDSLCYCIDCKFQGQVRDFRQPIYNHIFTLAFSIETPYTCSEDPEDWPSREELIATIHKRISALAQSDDELFEAIGPPEDSYEVDTLEFRPPLGEV